ncbi:MAG: glycosyl transferase group 1 [Acidimicrobiales bacterium]|nr:glycosyl transferase group 1 [Acidimicrobiales bacterium]
MHHATATATLHAPEPLPGTPPTGTPRPEAARLVLDARWWDVGGTGAFTRSLFRGLSARRPDHHWTVWGPAAVPMERWPGARLVPTDVGPARWFGQRQAFRVPPADLVVHPHQTRPAHTRPAATCVLDLIQLQHPNRAVRVAMAQRLALTVRRASVLFTIAPSVRDQLVSEHGVDPACVHVLHLPVDRSRARIIEARRSFRRAQEGGAAPRVLLGIGHFVPHKNHRRLVEAFAATRFAASGGRLHLAGGEPSTLGIAAAELHPGVRLLGPLDQASLDAQLAGALALVQPSLAEGYGLPVAEALAAAVPVVSSPIPAVTEFGPAGVPTFDPRSTSAMAEAIDRTVDLVEAGTYWQRVDRPAWLAEQPSEEDLAGQVLAAVEPFLASRRAAPAGAPAHHGTTPMATAAPAAIR